ncbi:MAG TPA: endolytic transglycosylase MltG [Thermoanaerobaculia bacterium]|nr:endolytic transglycosylase MltG [Thermoanaerobaculia bacterium]
MAKGKRSRGGKKGGGCRRVFLGAFILLLLLLVPAGMVAWSWRKLERPYQGYPEPERQVTIAPGTSATQTLVNLQREGVLADARLARVYLVYSLHDPKIQAGEYLFRGLLTTPQVLRMLIKGQTLTHRFTLVEGMTLEETADQLATQGFGRRGTFLDEMRSPQRIADLDPEARDLEGYLFPETYSFASRTGEKEVVDVLVRTFRRRFERDVRPLLAQGPPGRSARQVVILASIVEKEAKASSERPLIAAVYQNRVQQKIGLAADPTVIYALKKLGRWDGNLRRDDLRMDSPYNTYRWAGLPPGPICSPGLASLKAAAVPAHVPYLYFVSRNDGTHVFAETLAEHNRNVEIWQRQYWRDRRAAGR